MDLLGENGHQRILWDIFRGDSKTSRFFFQNLLFWNQKQLWL